MNLSQGTPGPVQECPCFLPPKRNLHIPSIRDRSHVFVLPDPEVGFDYLSIDCELRLVVESFLDHRSGQDEICSRRHETNIVFANCGTFQWPRFHRASFSCSPMSRITSMGARFYRSSFFLIHDHGPHLAISGLGAKGERWGAGRETRSLH